MKGPILRHIQFSTEPRIDHIVDSLFNVRSEHHVYPKSAPQLLTNPQGFSKEFFPNEMVIWQPEGHPREEARIREKTSFPEIKNPDGSIARPAKARYFVELPKRGGDALLARTEELTRHRKYFNKQVLRSFLKNSVTHDHWSGAPWIVKEEIAKLHHIPTEVPANLRQEAVLEEKEKRKSARSADMDQFIQGLADKGKLPGVVSGTVLTPAQLAHFHSIYLEQQSKGDKHGKGAGRLLNGKTSVFQATLSKAAKQEPLKFPCDDLKIPNKKRNSATRPALKFLTSDYPVLTNVDLEEDPLSLTGDLLQIWHTMNVFAPLFVLDSFTFDDMVQALAVWSRHQPCELFSELHCSLLKVVVDGSGELQVRSLGDNAPRNSDSWESYLLPDFGSDDDAIEVEIENGNGHIKSGPLSVADKARIFKAFPSTEAWTSRAGERMFTNDTWQFVMIGLLAQIAAKSKEFRLTCEQLLVKLMPADEEVDLDESNARSSYSALDLASRVKILQLVILHVPDTSGVRNFMEDCDKEATETRKKKIAWQSRKKPLVREWQELDQQRKLLRPDTANAADEQGLVAVNEDDDTDAEADSDAEQEDEDTKNQDQKSSSEDEDTMLSTRSSGRANLMKRKREEDEARVEREKKVKVDFDDTTKYRKVLQDMSAKAEEIQACEEEIRQHDNALRENACHRARKLGTDRYLNHYYWYERNGMAFGGDEDSSTAEYGYANACIWVQGPDALQAQNVVHLDAAAAKAYAKETGIDLVERRNRDEGSTQLADANSWGYIDAPEDVDRLLAYLDERGRDEKNLRKELKTWRGEITKRMQLRAERLAQLNTAASQPGDDDDEPVIGVATRRKHEATRAEAMYPCLAWYNSMALGELGRIHSDGKRGKPGPKPKGTRQKAAAAAAAAAVINEKLTTRSGRRR